VYAQEFTLKSDDLSGQLTETQVFSGFGCTGKNISPALKWINAPKGTKSITGFGGIHAESAYNSKSISYGLLWTIIKRVLSG